MQWTSEKNAGFTTPDARPWLPPHPLFAQRNVAVQDANRRSLLHCYKRLLALRAAHPALHSGTLSLLPNATPETSPILGYERACAEESLHVLGNFSAQSQPVTLQKKELLFSTCLDDNRQQDDRYTLRPWEAIVLTSR